ncbi:diguanylate cyclase [Thiorhodococcus mannitoliphagus]|uniref:Diguanylate cyclase n=1 Tax=Thiorhodococcus mannitoliphagus TaxID=329406 RepID=A0A6P1DQR2_9GAMM|nr:diguanylate cyclase [Thiorhodococcus mannitoliphagus]NEX19271.1 diguanylate cyclase [Thiorhodococcus mannitoliphagus]
MLKTTWRPFWTWFPPLALLPLVGLASLYHWQMADFEADLRRTEGLVIEAQTAVVTRKLDRLLADIRILAAQNELAAFLDTADPSWLPKIAQEYLAVSRWSQVYDQIRYLDEDGMEVVRVNFNDGHPAIVRDSDLQNKHDRYYFTETLALSAGEIYASPLDLNIENGALERPYKPMIRVGTPVFDRHGNRRGIVLVNFLAQQLLDAILDVDAASISASMLLNAEGYWLLSPDPSLNWGFMIPERRDARMQSRYPEAWHAMNQSPSGHVLTDRGLFSFRTLTPMQHGHRALASETSPSAPPATDQWILVAHVSEASLGQTRSHLMFSLIPLGVVILLLLAVGLRASSVARIERKRHQAQLEKMARMDAVTGVANRLSLEEQLAREHERARRHARTLALLYIDLDGFKAINDTLGHLVGDQVLKEIATTLATECRSEDVVGRLGGDEFAVVLLEPLDMATAALVAERIRDRIAALRWDRHAVTASIGLALYPDHASEVPELIRLADTAMYASKDAGKNRVTLASDVAASAPVAGERETIASGV